MNDSGDIWEKMRWLKTAFDPDEVSHNEPTDEITLHWYVTFQADEIEINEQSD